MQFIIDLDNINGPRDNDNHSREVSISHEGSDIVFENLLGDFQQNSNKKDDTSSSDPNGNTKLKSNKDPITAIMDEIFEPESHKNTDAVSIFTDDQDDDDLESEQEGWDPYNTTFVQPSDTPQSTQQDDNGNDDPFAAILADLDEKTKEIEEKKKSKNSKNSKSEKPAKKQKKKKPKSKKKSPSPSKPSPVANNNQQQQPNNQPQQPNISNIGPAPSITVPIGNEPDAQIISEDILFALKKWEFDDKMERKNIRILLSTLHQILPESILNKWKIVKMSGLLNDGNVRKHYLKSVRVAHPDKSMQRGDDKETQIICNHIFQALEQAYSKHTK